LLLIFAMLAESVFGIHGAIANLAQSLVNLADWNWEVILYRSYHFETIHTIAWAIILNGIVQGILSRNGGWKNAKRLITIYAFLAAVILVLTPIMWGVVDLIIPDYPFATNPLTGKSVQYPYLGISEWWEFITLFFFNAIAGKEEPMFPYLAVSFIGSIVGIMLAQERKEVHLNFPKRMMQIGFLAFIIGAIGLVVNLIVMMDTSGIDATLNMYKGLAFHRNWVPENGVPFLGWLFQFLCLNGTALCLIMVVVRVVEFRGRGKQFADKTRFIRRFGFVAFTVYSIQFVYYIVHYFISSLFYGEAYKKLDWGGTFFTMGIVFLLFWAILILWEKVKFTGSFEWSIGTIAALVIPARKVKVKWWKAGQLNVEEAFYNAEWLNIVEKDEISHETQTDSKLVSKLSWFGFIFVPISIITYIIARNSVRTEKANKFNKRARIVALAGIIFFLIWLILSLFLSLSDLGISL
jgi:hypothetical protein